MASFSEFVCFCSARTSCDKGDLYAIQPRGQRGSLIKIGYSFNLLRAMSGWEYNDPEKYWHCRRSPDEPAERHSLPEAPRAPAHGGPAAAGATAIRRGEGRIARAVGQGGAVGGHAPPPAFAEPQPRRALLRRRADPGALGARVGPLQHERSARAAECCAHDAASTKGAASTGGLALPPSAQGRGAEVRGGCSVPLGARAAWARQMRGEHARGCPDKLSPSKRTARNMYDQRPPRKPPKSMDPDAEESCNPKTHFG